MKIGLWLFCRKWKLFESKASLLLWKHGDFLHIVLTF